MDLLRRRRKRQAAANAESLIKAQVADSEWGDIPAEEWKLLDVHGRHALSHLEDFEVREDDQGDRDFKPGKDLEPSSSDEVSSSEADEDVSDDPSYATPSKTKRPPPVAPPARKLSTSNRLMQDLFSQPKAPKTKSQSIGERYRPVASVDSESDDESRVKRTKSMSLSRSAPFAAQSQSQNGNKGKASLPKPMKGMSLVHMGGPALSFSELDDNNIQGPARHDSYDNRDVGMVNETPQEPSVLSYSGFQDIYEENPGVSSPYEEGEVRSDSEDDVVYMDTFPAKDAENVHPRVPQITGQQENVLEQSSKLLDAIRLQDIDQFKVEFEKLPGDSSQKTKFWIWKGLDRSTMNFSGPKQSLLYACLDSNFYEGIAFLLLHKAQIDAPGWVSNSPSVKDTTTPLEKLIDYRTHNIEHHLYLCILFMGKNKLPYKNWGLRENVDCMLYPTGIVNEQTQKSAAIYACKKGLFYGLKRLHENDILMPNHLDSQGKHLLWYAITAVFLLFRIDADPQSITPSAFAQILDHEVFELSKQKDLSRYRLKIIHYLVSLKESQKVDYLVSVQNWTLAEIVAAKYRLFFPHDLD